MEEISCCMLCPRSCGVKRNETGSGFCKSPAVAMIARAALHFWEEPPLSGNGGAGAVFFTGCSLGCVYCQNKEISRPQKPIGRAFSPREMSELFFKLIDEGAQNIDLVTPTHFAPMIREALLIKKLPVPVVYNSSGYENVSTLKSLEGLIDIYLPDFKYAENELAQRLSGAYNYPETALAAIREMQRQVGAPDYGANGAMQSGVLIRHLILPAHTKNSIKALQLIKREFPLLPVSLMAQYTPPDDAGFKEKFPELARKITPRELKKVEDELFRLELDGFVQDRASANAEYLPDFHQFD